MASNKRASRSRVRRQAFGKSIAKCCDKVTYASRGAAMAATDGMAAIHNHKFRAYRCANGGWHLTTNIRGTLHG